MEQNINSPIFLHFLSRGLMESVNGYDISMYNQIEHDFKLAMLLGYEPAYISTAHLFESTFATRIYQNYSYLFCTGHIEISQQESNFNEFVRKKKDQYQHIREKYTNYWLPDYLKTDAESPRIRFTSGISRDLEKVLLQTMECEVLKRKAENERASKVLTNLSPYITHAIHERGNKAITNELFSDLYSKNTEFNKHSNTLDLLINYNYLLVQLERDGGTIVTGLSTAADKYSHLCPTPYTHNVYTWKKLYHFLGLNRIIPNLTSVDICEIRDSPVFIDFINAIRLFILEVNKLEPINLPTKVEQEFISFFYRKIRRKSPTKGVLSEIFLEHIQDIPKELLSSLNLISNYELNNSHDNSLIAPNIKKETTMNTIKNTVKTYEKSLEETKLSLAKWMKYQRLANTPDEKERADDKIQDLEDQINKIELMLFRERYLSIEHKLQELDPELAEKLEKTINEQKPLSKIKSESIEILTTFKNKLVDAGAKQIVSSIIGAFSST